MSFSSNTHTSPRSDVPTIPIGLSPADILRGAAQYLQRHGWTQGHYYADLHSPSPKACALGAIGIVAHGEVSDNPITDTDGCLDAVHAFVEYLDTVTDDVPVWNDHPRRIAEQVIAALNNAADHWEYI